VEAYVAEVVVELGGKEILRVPLKGQAMTIGRDPTCDLHLDNRALSRRHAQIEKKGAAIWVRDLKSQNGTFINGNRVGDAQALNGGDRIEVGRYEVRIEGVEEARNDTPVLTLMGPEGRHRFAMVVDEQGSGEIVIGRAPSCDIAIGHKSISRRHVRIAVEGGQFIAEDLGSQNGSRINNKRISGPTPFRLGDKIQMSDFTIEVGYLDAPQTTGAQKSKTMMIDRSELAKAAYIGGDLEGNGNNQAANISFGQQEQGGGFNGRAPHTGEHPLLGEESGVEATRGIPQADDEPPPPPSRRPQKASPPPPQDRRKQGPGRPSAAATAPLLTVTHPDANERTVVLEGDVTILGEDGTPGDHTDQRSYADQGYLVFIRSARGVVATVAGDRRLLVLNGEPQLTATLEEGDSLELGVLTVVFHNAG
jgi:pSer/pThr/pTyr-binding forkhead associated (FHA) protein